MFRLITDTVMVGKTASQQRVPALSNPNQDYLCLNRQRDYLKGISTSLSVVPSGELLSPRGHKVYLEILGCLRVGC